MKKVLLAIALIIVSAPQASASGLTGQPTGVIVDVIKVPNPQHNFFMKKIRATKIKDITKLSDEDLIFIATEYCPDNERTVTVDSMKELRKRTGWVYGKSPKLDKTFKTYAVRYLCATKTIVWIEDESYVVWIPNTNRN